MIHQLALPNFTPTTLNKVTRGTFRQRVRLAKGDKEIIAYEAMRQQIPLAEMRRRVSLVVTVTMGQRRPDEDGLWKVLLDALVAAKLLKNDSPKWCRQGDVQWVRGVTRHTTVILEDMRGGIAAT